MNEIVHLVAQKTGLSEEKAQQATEVVINYLKDKLPGPLASQLNQFTGSAASTEGGGVLDRIFGEKAS
jgi:nucleoid DNA-binding protein